MKQVCGAFRNLSLLPALLLLCCSGMAQPISQVFEEWATAEGTQEFFVRAAMTTDANGFTYVVGATLNGSGNYDFLVAKYNDEGELVWADQYDGDGNGDDIATAVAVDDNGNVFVTGGADSGGGDTLDVVTIGYDELGARQWLEVWAGADGLVDAATCIALSGDHVYVGGVTTDASDGLDYLCLKYDTDDGTLAWDSQQDYNHDSNVCTQLSLWDASVLLGGATQTGVVYWDMLVLQIKQSDGTYEDDAVSGGGSAGFTHVRAMERDGAGNIYLTGTLNNGASGQDIHTVKIDDAMTVLWEVDYSSDGNQDDEGNALAIDENTGNVYVGGYKDSTGQGTDFVTLMYDAGGNLDWAVTWNDTADGADTLKGLVVDGDGNVTVTGTAWNGHSLDYHTIQYDNSGAVLWEISFNDKYGYDDRPMDIAHTADGGVAVVGQRMNPDTTWSYVTVKYKVHEFVMPVDSDSVSTSLRWLANRDQLTDSTDTNLVERVRFYSNHCYPNVYMMDDTLSYVFFQGVDTSDVDTLHRIDMTFVASEGGHPLLPVSKETYWNNYYLGHIPEGRPFVPLYKYQVMQDVWPNIDVEYSSNQRGLKYYLIVHPGGEVGAIALRYHGFEDLYVDGNDALVIASTIGELVQPQAIAYEMDGAGELSLLGWQPSYVVDDDEVSFEDFGEWDGTLVVEVNWGYVALEPAEAPHWWSTYMTGVNTGDDFVHDVTMDVADYLYVTGSTSSTDFPVFGASIQPVIGGGIDAFVGQFDNYYKQEWLTYFGGSEDDRGYGVAHDANANTVYMCGETNSSNANLLLTPYGSGSYQDVLLQGYVSGFVANTGAKNWVTGFGGENTICKKVAVDEDGNIYVVGNSGALNNQVTCTPLSGFFPICGTGGAYVQELRSSLGGLAQDGFIVKFDLDRALEWSTFFGGEQAENVHGLAIDNTRDRLYVVGSTRSSTTYYSVDPFPVLDNSGYFQDVNMVGIANASDGFLARFSTDGELNWSTFFGGLGDEDITGVAVSTATSSDGYVMVCGHTSSDAYADLNTGPEYNNEGFPRYNSGTAFEESFGGGNRDPFVAMFNDRNDCIWSTFLGGTEDEGMHFRSPGISVTESGTIYVAGSSYSGSNSSSPFTNFSTSGSSVIRHQPAHADVGAADNTTDLYLFRFSDAGDMQFGTYFGGNGNALGVTPRLSDVFGGMVCDESHVFLGGGTYSTTNFPRRRAFTQSYLHSQPNTVPLSASLRGFLAQLQFGVFVSVPEPTVHSNDLKVFPNPGNGRFTLTWDEQKPGSVFLNVHNSLGYLIKQVNFIDHLGTNSIDIDLIGQPSGIYIVNLLGKKGGQSIRIVLQ